MDQFDQAQELDARYLQQALGQHKERMIAMGGESLTHCQDCGDEIPEARRKFLPGVTRCVDCARKREERERRR